MHIVAPRISWHILYARLKLVLYNFPFYTHTYICKHHTIFYSTLALFVSILCYVIRLAQSGKLAKYQREFFKSLRGY